MGFLIISLDLSVGNILVISSVASRAERKMTLASLSIAFSL
jgi:hypothetical protein